MAGRKPKITNSDSDRADQRTRTEQMFSATSEMEHLSEKPPSYLEGSIAIETWKKIVPQLNKAGLLKQADSTVMAVLCQQVQILRMAYAEIMANGVVLEDGHKNPACQVLDSATAKVKSLAESLGLTPQARVTLVNVHKNTSQEDSGDIKTKLQSEGDDKW